MRFLPPIDGCLFLFQYRLLSELDPCFEHFEVMFGWTRLLVLNDIGLEGLDVKFAVPEPISVVPVFTTSLPTPVCVNSAVLHVAVSKYVIRPCLLLRFPGFAPNTLPSRRPRCEVVAINLIKEDVVFWIEIVEFFLRIILELILPHVELLLPTLL